MTTSDEHSRRSNARSMVTTKDHLIIRVCHASTPDEGLIRQGAGRGVNHGVVCRVIYGRMRGPTPQSSSIISFISSASMAGSFHATPSPVTTKCLPIMPSVMQRTNFAHGVSSSLQNLTHALAVLYRNSSLPIQREAFQVS